MSPKAEQMVWYPSPSGPSLRSPSEEEGEAAGEMTQGSQRREEVERRDPSRRLGPETTLVVRMALDPFPTRAGQSLTGLGAGHLPFTQRSHLRAGADHGGHEACRGQAAPEGEEMLRELCSSSWTLG